MKINRKTHLELRLQNLLFTLLFLAVVGLVAWLSTRYTAQFDWTAGGRHTLSEASRKVLDLMKEPVTITAYARENAQLRNQIRDQVGRYSRYKNDLTLNFVNPDTQPDKVRELGITMDGEMMVDYQGRTEKIQNAEEATLTNALQRLAVAKERHVVFLEGHGERSPQGQANHDLGQFGEELERKGITVSMVNLAVTPDIPDNTNVLVLAGPRANFLPGEITLVQNYVKNGGNLLWLTDPGELHGLDPLAQQLGIKFLPGTVVDASTQLFGIDDPTFALVAEYPAHPITFNFQTMTLFPAATALDKSADGDFQREPLLSTLARSWTETGAIEGKIQFDADKGERKGPLQIGYTLTREIKPTDKTEPAASASKSEAKPSEAKPNEGSKAEQAGQPEAGAAKDAGEKPSEQRIVVIGDGDFLSNAFLGNGGNLDLGLNIVHWLSQNEALINIPAKTAPDRKLELSPVASGVIAIGFLIALPAGLIGTGAAIWFKRRRR
ncbi:GldG family protein [Methylocaldum sp. GT1BB]|uniref:GldG family protein n=1 Tax=Methylocaldum sp. GT1BB TaxID=3438963 RepID=UPI003DA1C474